MYTMRLFFPFFFTIFNNIFLIFQQTENDVTLLAHLSMDRLQILESLAKLWQGEF